MLPLPDWSGLADETQDGQLANPLPGVRMVWRPDDFAAWPSGIDGSVAPGDLIQSQFGPAATITVTIAAETELASLAPPTLPARPHARRTHFSRHDYQPFFANAPETYRGYRTSPPGRTSPVMIFPPAIDAPWRRRRRPLNLSYRSTIIVTFLSSRPETQKPAKAHHALRVFDPGAFVPLTLSLWHK
jgi:hypothetical protein